MTYEIQNGTILISEEDKPLADQYKWRLDSNGYAITCVWNKDTKCKETVRLHQLLMGKPEQGFLIDHIDRNPSNNQRNNLRFITYKENWYNSSRADEFFNKGVLRNTKLYLHINGIVDAQ